MSVFLFFMCVLSHPYLAQGSGKMQNSLSISDSDGSSFVHLVVLELAKNTEAEAITWLLSRITDKQKNGGKRPNVNALYTPRMFVFVDSLWFSDSFSVVLV